MSKPDKLKPNLFLLLSIAFILVGLVVIAIKEKGYLVLWLNDLHTISFDFFFKYYTFLGSGWILLAILVISIFYNYRLSILTFLIAGFQGLTSIVFKGIFFPDVQRPIAYFKAVDLQLVEGVTELHLRSFPSGHSMTAFGVATLLSSFTNKWWLQVFLFIYAFLVAVSRIYLALHFLRDTIAGAIIGIAITLSVIMITRKYRLLVNSKFDQGLIE